MFFQTDKEKPIPEPILFCSEKVLTATESEQDDEFFILKAE